MKAESSDLKLIDTSSTQAVDRSAIYKRLRQIWQIVATFISIQRTRLLEEGKSRRVAGQIAWQLADEEFDSRAIDMACELQKTMHSPPAGLTPELVVAWRVADAIIRVSLQRSRKLIDVAAELVEFASLRQEMGRSEDNPPHEESQRQRLVIELMTSKESSLTVVDQVTATLQAMQQQCNDDLLIDELNAVLEALSVSRQVLEEDWETTAFALRDD